MKYPIPEDTINNQAAASNPENSVWVSAHAGSGKTHVLSQRVMRLLLQGTDPSRILCLTYTRAAAANMANRVFSNLGNWAMMGEAELSEEIRKVEGKTPDAATMRRARQLFARALETPGGLKIQTIHAFCEALLHQFPLEANIAGHFELLDGQAAANLIAESRRALLIGTGREDDPELSEAFADVLMRAGEHGLDKLLDAIIANRDDLQNMIAASESQDLALDYGFASGETAQSLIGDLWPDDYFTRDRIRSISDIAIAKAKANAGKFSEKLSAITPQSTQFQIFESLKDAFLTKGAPRKPSQIAVKDVTAIHPDLADQISRKAEEVAHVADRAALLEMISATRSMLVIADRLIGNYTRLKHLGGFLDFDDLIRRTVALLARQDAGPWIRFRLDQGIDHILVDEAQDTSPAQWDVIRYLADEFFSGEGARPDIQRTIFAVGDEKQSIYSFQGAEPEAFDHHRQIFKQRVEAVDRSFENIKLNYSFRSTEDVLTAVDHVFELEDSRRGLTQDGNPFLHKAIRAGDPGDVEIWPFIAPEASEEPDDWTQAIDHASAPAVRLAERIAERIRQWIDGGALLEGKGRCIRPGDIMVLVRKRDSFVHALNRALKNHMIPVAGADRLSLSGHIAVQDLVALGRVVMLPEDDLSLAAVLKSPLFGLNEEELYELAQGRADAVSLYSSLRRASANSERLQPVFKQLDRWRNEAGFRPAYEFYASVLGRDGMRARIVARLGHEAGEILDEFQNFLLNAERTGPPDLETTLAQLDSSGPDIKREMDQTRDEVRIMTVHAAKGLEAPIVFLVDSGSAPFHASHLPPIVMHESDDALPQKRFLWHASADLNNSLVDKITEKFKAKSEEEYRRLLYVGMTRAEDRLVVCGYHGAREPKAATWLSMARTGLEGKEGTQVVTGVDGSDYLHFRVTKGQAKSADEKETALHERSPLPESLLTRLAPQPKLPRPLAPSHASLYVETLETESVDERSPVLDPSLDPGIALARGIAIHRLLQILPDLPQERREISARRYLDSVGESWPQREREQSCRSVMDLLEDERFAPFFGTGSRAEVSIMGTLDIGGKEHAVTGSIDRLCVSEDEVLVLDYKTNRPAPRELAEIPQAYIVQLALYREMLLPLYPAKKIRAALLFTEAARLIELPQTLMEEALATLALPKSSAKSGNQMAEDPANLSDALDA